MKKTILSFLVVVNMVLGVNAQNVNIPDANFKAYLIGNATINTDADPNEISVIEAAAFTGNVNCQNLSINDLTGIEAFTNILYLYCNNNNLTTIDISNSEDLIGLRCNNNQLSSLDLFNNSYLTELYCYANNLTSLDVSHLADLETFKGQTNQIVSLDFNLATNLVLADCGYNNLSHLDVSNGNNTNMISFKAQSNSNLACIEVDDVVYSDANWGFIDAASSFSTNCPPPPCTVSIPDANFKAYLVGNTAINTNGDSEIQCSEANSFNGTINCSSLSISDLTGIEEFVNLNQLNFLNNNVSSLDISNNTALTLLNCEQNNLSSIDVSLNTNLTSISCGNNNTFSNLDLTNNTALTYLRCVGNGITSLDLSNNIDLGTLYAQFNDLTELDLSLNSSLTSVDLESNNLNMLNIANGANSSINSGFFNAENNSNLTCITVSDESYCTVNWTDIDLQTSFSTNCNVLVNSIDVQGQASVTTITTQNGTLQMEATVLPANADDLTYTWSVMDGSGTATIDASGLLTAITDGIVTVIANANDVSGIAGTVTITISNQTVGLNEFDSKNISIYPNPVQNELFVVLDNEEIIKMDIFDLSGKVIKSADTYTSQIDVSELSEGIYILQVYTQTGVSNIRFVKQ